MHFAGLKAVGESCQKPLMYYKNNMESTFNLLEVSNSQQEALYTQLLYSLFLFTVQRLKSPVAYKSYIIAACVLGKENRYDG